MKINFEKQLIILLLTAAVICSLCSCSKNSPDAGVIMREAQNSAEKMGSCESTYKRTLIFSAGGNQYDCASASDISYVSNPFTLKSVQTSKNGNSQSENESYTVTSGNKLWYYCKSGGTWQKTEAAGLNTSPLEQLDALRLLKQTESYNYVREMDYSSQRVHKIEVKFKDEILRSTIEDITDKTGMAKNSKTIVQTLLDSAPDIYGYCYVNKSSGNIVHIEADVTDAVNSVFKNIDGASVKISVSKCDISGDIKSIGKKINISLPEDAENAADVQAYG